MKPHRIIRLLPLLLTAATTLAQTTAPSTPVPTINVWPAGKMPGPSTHDPESPLPPRGDGVTRITNVSHPTLTLFPAPNATPNTPALIVCPGGGYSYVVVDKEGSEIAHWLNSAGITALVLKYRTPHNREGALQDIQRALSLTRAHAADWHIDPTHLGVIGFSAGGNLAAKSSCLFDHRSYAPLDAVDDQPCRPDFAILVYPAYLDDKQGHLSPDLNPHAHIPPTLIVHSQDDHTFVPGSKLYDAALTASHIPHTFLLYPTGGHGYALHCTRDARAWPQAALDWLHNTHILPAPPTK